ncbi:MAG TPA: 8-amino-7-oxononanoate synthase [Thermoanaerobaculia bacterium]|nr:8-amino-7-oxononanoate synthase [Thermoanaerobaculia bacterium]
MTRAAGVAGGRLLERIERELDELTAAGLRRHLALPDGVDFSSNDYLGLARDEGFRGEVVERVRAAAERGEPLGAPASRLLRGHLEIHERVEQRLAAFKGAEAALVLPSGWQANATLIGGLVRAGDRVLSDRLNHASLIDALRASGCRRVVVPHLDLAALARELDRAAPAGETFVVVESLYSMDGDLAPLSEIARECERAGAHLLVDEAHATGLYGEARGSGRIEACRVESEVLASVTTFGKALALSGAAIAGPRRLIELLVQRARPLVFSTAVPPLLLLALEVALDRVEREPERRRRLHANARRLRARLAGAGLGVAPEGSPIVPVIVGGNERAVAVAERIRARGLDVRAVRPPTVPEGTARLRVSVHASHRDDELDALADALAEELR